MGRLTPCAARTATLTPKARLCRHPATELKRNSFRDLAARDLLQIFSTRGIDVMRRTWNANEWSKAWKWRYVCFVSTGEKKKETMKQWGAINRWDYSRVCMPRVSHNRRKYDVNLTATTVAHRLSLQLSTSWVCANRESGLVMFFPIHVVFPPW